METYEVEKLVAKRVHHGVIQYLVKWVGYDHAVNTWEPYEHVKHLQNAIEEYEATRPKRGRPRKSDSSSVASFATCSGSARTSAKWTKRADSVASTATITCPKRGRPSKSDSARNSAKSLRTNPVASSIRSLLSHSVASDADSVLPKQVASDTKQTSVASKAAQASSSKNLSGNFADSEVEIIDPVASTSLLATSSSEKLKAGFEFEDCPIIKQNNVSLATI